MEPAAQRLQGSEKIWLAILFVIFAALQLGSGHPFHRPLIDLDDRTIVGALEQAGLGEYFTKRMWRPEAFAFPVRDLTYLFDHALSRSLGVQTFIATNVALFLVYTIFVYSWLRRILPVPAALFILSIVVMHPANIEIVQWAISRKHLLVGIFTILGVLLVTRMAATKEDRPIPLTRWAGLLALNALSLLSHPTGALFPLWAGAMLFRKCRKGRRRSALILYLALALSMTWFWLRHTTEENSDYRGLLDQTGDNLEGGEEKIRHLALGIGRATWQLLLPVRQAIYFDIDSKLNLIGLFLFAAALGLFIVIAKSLYNKNSTEARLALRDGMQNLLLAGLLFAPAAAFVMKRTDFVIADRFLFLSLPYLLAGAAQLVLAFTTSNSNSDQSWLSMRNAAVASAALVSLYLVPSLSAAPRWESEAKLYQYCVQTEGSDRCWFHYVSRLLESGCWEVAKQAEELQTELKKSAASKARSLYRSEGGLVLSICDATAMGPTVESRSALLDALVQSGATEQSLTFARNLLSVESGKPLDALYRTTTQFLLAAVDPSKMSQAMLGTNLGQLEVLNALDAVRAKGSAGAVSTFRSRYASVQIAPSAIVLGQRLTLQSLARGKGAQ